MLSAEIIVVVDLISAKSICQWIMDHFLLISIDIEGVNLGRDGEITMVQISTSEKMVFCFDILALGSAVFSNQYLGQILNSEKIFKLCYDCRIDADVLKTKFNISLQSVYDVQVLYTFIFQNDKDRYLKGLHHALETTGILKTKIGKKILQHKKDFKESLCKEGSGIFLQRPLTEKVLSYCVVDVIYLFKMFYEWGNMIEFNTVVQASMYRLNKFCNRCCEIPGKKMASIDFKQMPKVALQSVPYGLCVS